MRFALTTDGRITQCCAREDQIGRGRCNHILHQNKGESVNDFILRAQSVIDDLELGDISNSDTTQHDDKETLLEYQKLQAQLPTQSEITSMADALVGDSSPRTPDYMSIIESTYPWPFSIGTPGSDGHVHAEISSVTEGELYTTDNGTIVRDLTATFEYNGRTYPVVIGQVPVENEHGLLTINGVDWRYVPVISQWKTGGHVGPDGYVRIFQADERNIAFSYKPGDKFVTACGVNVPIHLAEKMIANPYDEDLIAKIKKTTKTKSDSFVYAFRNLSPRAIERFDLNNGVHLNNLSPDEVNDITDRRCYDYASVVEATFQRNLRTMGTTFRRNYLAGKNDHLFVSGTFTHNLRDEITGRSNLQAAETLNPIAEMSQRSRLSWCGGSQFRSEGWNRNAAPMELRYPHASHRDLIDPFDVSSGKNIGLTATMSHAKLKNGYVVHDASATAVSDFIPFITHNDPSRTSMGVAHMKQACPIIGGEDPKVSTPAWKKISGAKLGCNLTTAYIPMGDGVHEDAVIISESAAKKMTTMQSLEFKPNGKKRRKNPAVGTWLSRGSVVNGATVHSAGIVSEVKPDGTVVVQSMYPMGVGDKISNRHGNKGVISKVLPDSEMPMVYKDGKESRADLIYSPLSIASRANMGQVMEANNGVLEQKAKVRLNTGKMVDATAGDVFIMRLNHIAEKKLSAWANEKNPDGSYKGHRFGSMESLLLTSTPERRRVLEFIRNQEGEQTLSKMQSIMRSVGIKMERK